jgi:hypothetical protein
MKAGSKPDKMMMTKMDNSMMKAALPAMLNQ